MGKQTQVSKELTWRNHLARHASSGKSVSAFCRDEAISEGSFYAWRSRLRVATVNTTSTPRLQKKPAPFIDLGVVKEHSKNAPFANSNIEVHIDLGGGISLTITRH